MLLFQKKCPIGSDFGLISCNMCFKFVVSEDTRHKFNHLRISIKPDGASQEAQTLCLVQNLNYHFNHCCARPKIVSAVILSNDLQ